MCRPLVGGVSVPVLWPLTTRSWPENRGSVGADLERNHDDGGFVDLNHAPAHTIGEVCDLDPEFADAIVAARTAHGCSDIDEVVVISDLPTGSWDTIRDRGILIP